MSSSSSFADQRGEENKGADPATVAAEGSVLTGHEKEELWEGGDSNSCSLDRINGFPDEILVNVLSSLTLKEAARTSVLSNRWKDLWKSAVTVMDFEHLTKLNQILDRHAAPKKQIRRWQKEHRRWFIDWVNGVLTQLQQQNHRGSKLSKFRICFTLNKRCNSEGDIDRWLEFAISREVEHLELSLNMMRLWGEWDYDSYPFSQGCFNHIKTPTGLSNIKSLRSLRLSYVAVKGEVLQHFISNCPFLEVLDVEQSRLLKALKVVGSSTSPLPLKHLEVKGCLFLRSVEIEHAPHLSHLIHEGRVAELRVDNCPRLVDVTIFFDDWHPSKIPFLSSYAGQLESLTLETSQRAIKFLDVPELPRLKSLTLRTDALSCDSILGLIPVINACPSLQKLTVKLLLYSRDSSNHSGLYDQQGGIAHCEGIKVVEVVGFSGYHVDCEFVDYVLEHFVGLERMVIDRGLTTPFRGELKNNCSKKQAKKARKLALKYKSKASASLEFLVI
ncbi:unnamed protein product [Linum tenue]|uniref:F-box domain-containing protein n=1 Tax=Linum tenue TaxID=586396 RepID=A0AAV0NL71_9ROSI|nr:unnamed protein product [Linum tenue]